MPALKLFVSHSSRLDDVDAGGLPAQHNWDLLKATCDKLEAHYGDRIEILVDLDLRTADAWEHRLDEWLAECHAAIILFSKRAIESSNWVKKEATILSWRREFDAGFKLIPVMLDQQATPDDLVRDYFRTLRIDASQCVRNAACADDILKGVKQALGEPESLIGPTPFDALVDSVEKIIAKDVEAATLQAAWNRVSDAPAPHTGQPDSIKRYAQGLARHLLRDGPLALERFLDVLDGLRPQPTRERAEELLKYLRALWVDARAAGCLPAAKLHGEFLALNGELVACAEPQLNTQCFTLERYMERAWPGTDQFKVIPLSKAENLDAVRNELRAKFRPNAASMPPQRIDDAIARDKRHIIILFPAPEGDFPDARLLQDLETLKTPYPRLICVFATGATLPVDTPEGVRAIVPRLEADTEWAQFDKEIEARELIDRKYGAHS